MEKICFTRDLLLLIHGAAAADAVPSKMELGRLLKIGNGTFRFHLNLTNISEAQKKTLTLPFPNRITQNGQISQRIKSLLLFELESRLFVNLSQLSTTQSAASPPFGNWVSLLLSLPRPSVRPPFVHPETSDHFVGLTST